MKYQKRETQKIPENFRRFTPRVLRAFRRVFDHDERDRAKATDIMKYMKDKWLDTKLSSKAPLLLSRDLTSDKDSVLINLSTTNKITKSATMLSYNPEERLARTRRITSSVGLLQINDIGEPLQDLKTRINIWLSTCSPEPEPLEDQQEVELPSIIVTSNDMPRPLSYEQWCIITNNNIVIDKFSNSNNSSRKPSLK